MLLRYLIAGFSLLSTLCVCWWLHSYGVHVSNNINLPKVYATYWQDNLEMEDDLWEADVSDAYSRGFNGMYMILHKTAPYRDPLHIANLCRRFLAVCERYNMECYISFGALDQAQEFHNLSIKEKLLSPLRNWQPLWKKGKEARSVHVDQVVQVCKDSPALMGVTLCEHPQFARRFTQHKYEAAVEAMAERIQKVAPHLQVLINNGHSGNIPYLDDLDIFNNTHDNITVTAHFFAHHGGRWTRQEIAQMIGASHVHDAFLSTIHFNNRQGTEEDRIFFLQTALEEAVNRGWSTGVFGYRDHDLHELTVGCKDAITETIRMLRKNHKLAPQCQNLRMRYQKIM